MSYVDAYFDREKDQIWVVERHNGKRQYTDYPARYVFYYDDPKGKHRSIYDTPVSRVSTKLNKDFQKELAMHKGKQIYEADVNPIFRCLEENYLDREAPNMHVAFFDIEVDFDPARGFSKPADPFMPITSITLYLQWSEQLVTIAVPPKTLTLEEAQDSVKDFDNTYIVETEAQLLETFLGVIEDADVLSGWNSEGYDIPYVINRIQKVLSKDDTRKLCLWKQLPKKRVFERFGREQETYDLVGRVHLDSLELYRKYTYEERHSYRLDAIGEHELGQKKTVYEGSLDQLYNQDFRTFVEYNRQDVNLIDKLDRKLKFIALTNELAHANTVLLQTTLGAVAVTEQAIINEAHRRGVQVPNRPKRDSDSTTAAGAYVAFPKKGLHDWIGSMDINSLYPSVIRALNMAPECVMGQLRPSHTDEYIEEQMTLQKKSFAGAWENHFGSLEYDAVMEQRKDISIHVDWEDGKSEVMSGAEVYKMVFDSNNPMMLSANGTIFTSEFEGVIPGLLARWYKERKEMQSMLKKAKEANNNAEIEFWDKRQLVKKINLNSLYGAILNPGCRFFDKRIGQSTTLSGRQISKHMAAKINEVITGEYNHVGKAIIYGDTDSAYFSAYEVLKKEINDGSIPWTKESVIKLYDQVCEEVNGSFKKFMAEAFHCLKSRAEVIQAGRESVAETGLFITKKRYAILIYDLEGYRQDVEDKPGKIKAMGLDLKRSDTPVFIQDFLNELLLMVLTKKTEAEVLDRISQFRNEFKQRPGWEKGSPRRANNIQEYAKKEARLGKANMPGHVRASLNWNNLKKMHSDKYSMEIHDGMKVIVCKLKKNPLEYTSVAYPTDEMHIPVWFKELPFDNDAMESTLIDNKLGNLLGVLGWDIKSTESKNTFNNLFDFGG